MNRKSGIRLHLKNLNPEIHSLITWHKLEHGHKNLEETIECIVKKVYEIENPEDKNKPRVGTIKDCLDRIEALEKEVTKLKESNSSL